MTTYFEIKDLKVNYNTYEGSKTVLDIDHIQIEKGKAYGIVGESGAGKTVLALTILGLLQRPPGEVEDGQIFLENENLLEKSPKYIEKIRGKKIAMIFQDPMSTLNPVFTIGYQMVQVIMKNQGLNKRKARNKAIEMLGTVNLPDAENAMVKYPHQLSGGQRQRVIIAMALSCGAEFIIADEPTRNLDVTIQAGILKLLKELQEKFRVTVLFIANNLGLVSTVCDEIGILYKGKIVEAGKVRDVLRNPKHEYTSTLIQAITKNKQENEKSHQKRVFDKDKDSILEVKNLKKYFPIKKGFFAKPAAWVKAVDDVDLVINKGEILGVVGESGCGKSTLVNTILNLHEPTSGKVVFDGNDIFSIDGNELRKTRKKIQIVFQDPFWSLNPRWLVKDIIGEPVTVHESLNANELLERIESLLEMVGLPKDAAYKYPHEFSGGQRQRIAIARSLAVNPKLVVLDEPTSSIDVLSQAQILKLLDDLKKRLELTYILISHDLSVVNYMADKIIVMYLGKVVESGYSYDVFNNPMHPYTKALFNAIPDIYAEGVDELTTLEGNVPSAINPPEGCRFNTRCPLAKEICKKQAPEIRDFSNEHKAACHFL